MLLQLTREAHRLPLLATGSGPAALALLSGEVQALFANVISLYPRVKAGITAGAGGGRSQAQSACARRAGARRTRLSKAGVSLWQGIMVPAKTPSAIVAKLSRAITEAARTPDSVERLVSQGAYPAGTTPREFADFLQSERTRWQRAREAKLTFDYQ